MALYVLDTSAVIAALREEPEYEKVQDLLRAADKDDETQVIVPFMALMEMQYGFLREMSDDDVAFWADVVRAWPVTIKESTAEWGREAARVKATAKLSLADAWIASLALQNGATLVHKDPEFESVLDLTDLRLVYDRDLR